MLQAEVLVNENRRRFRHFSCKFADLSGDLCPFWPACQSVKRANDVACTAAIGVRIALPRHGGCGFRPRPPEVSRFVPPRARPRVLSDASALFAPPKWERPDTANPSSEQTKPFPFESEFPLEATKRRKNPAGGKRSAAPGRAQTSFKPGTGGRMGASALPPLRGLMGLVAEPGVPLRFTPGYDLSPLRGSKRESCKLTTALQTTRMRPVLSNAKNGIEKGTGDGVEWGFHERSKPWKRRRKTGCSRDWS